MDSLMHCQCRPASHRIAVLALALSMPCMAAAEQAAYVPGLLIPVNDVVTEWSGREALAKKLAAAGYSGAEAKLAEMGENNISSIGLDEFLTFHEQSYASWRKSVSPRNADDTLKIDTLGFGSLVLRGDALYLLRRKSSWDGFWVPTPEPVSRKILDILPMPILRLGVGSQAFTGSAGLAVGPGGKDGRIGPFGAFEAGIWGYSLQTGLTAVYNGDRHMFPVFAAFGVDLNREWSREKTWRGGPLIQLGAMNLGFQGKIWISPELSGSAALLIQLYPLLGF